MLKFLDRLEAAKIWYHLIHVRESIMVELSIPGARWEVEFFADGHIEVERFTSMVVIEGAELLEQLFAADAS